MCSSIFGPAILPSLVICPTINIGIPIFLASFPKWMGQCSQCGEWNSIKEEVVRKQQSNKLISKENKVKEINEIESLEKERIIFNDNEFNRVLGGGLVKGSVVLISGDIK